MESFSVITRKAKNAYLWRGIDKITISIEAQIVSTRNVPCSNLYELNLTFRIICVEAYDFKSGVITR